MFSTGLSLREGLGIILTSEYFHKLNTPAAPFLGPGSPGSRAVSFPTRFFFELRAAPRPAGFACSSNGR